MDPILITFLAIGGLFTLIGGGMQLVAAFRVNVWWGVACLVVPFASLVFLFKHWDVARRGFFIGLLGSCIAVGGVFSSARGLAGVSKGPPKVATAAAAAAAPVKATKAKPQKPLDLNGQIMAKRNEIDLGEAQFRDDGAAVAQEFQALNARRAALKADDAAAVAAFNTAAAAYKQKADALKELRAEIDAAQVELTGLLDQRSRLGGAPGAKPKR